MMQKSNTDWRDALAAISLPEAPDSSADCGSQSEAPAEITKKLPQLAIFYERKGRGGKQATIISGFTCSDSELREVASVLKQRLATGGSSRGGEILIQGDRRSDAAEALRAMGYRVK